MRLLTDLNQRDGITVVMVTHEPEMADYASRVIHFVDGRVESDERASGRPPDALRDHPARAAGDPQERAALVPDRARRRHRRRRGDRHGDDRQRHDGAGAVGDLRARHQSPLRPPRPGFRPAPDRRAELHARRRRRDRAPDRRAAGRRAERQQPAPRPSTAIRTGAPRSPARPTTSSSRATGRSPKGATSSTARCAPARPSASSARRSARSSSAPAIRSARRSGSAPSPAT